MGKLKIIAKMKLLGESAPLFLMFVLGVFVLFVFGNFSFIISLIIEKFGFLVSSVNAKMITELCACAVGIILFTIFAAPLKLGREKWFLMKAKGEDPSFTEIFSYFNPKGIKKSISAWCYNLFLRLSYGLVFFFPCLCLSGVLLSCMRNSETAFYVVVALFVFDVMLFILGLIFSFIYSANFFLYYYIVVSNNNIKPKRAYEKSREIASGGIKNICRFKLSFSLWWLLCIFVIPAFYVWGYYKQSGALLAYRNEYLQ